MCASNIGIFLEKEAINIMIHMDTVQQASMVEKNKKGLLKQLCIIYFGMVLSVGNKFAA